MYIVDSQDWETDYSTSFPNLLDVQMGCCESNPFSKYINNIRSLHIVRGDPLMFHSKQDIKENIIFLNQLYYLCTEFYVSDGVSWDDKLICDYFDEIGIKSTLISYGCHPASLVQTQRYDVNIAYNFIKYHQKTLKHLSLNGYVYREILWLIQANEYDSILLDNLEELFFGEIFKTLDEDRFGHQLIFPNIKRCCLQFYSKYDKMYQTINDILNHKKLEILYINLYINEPIDPETAYSNDDIIKMFEKVKHYKKNKIKLVLQLPNYYHFNIELQYCKDLDFLLSKYFDRYYIYYDSDGKPQYSFDTFNATKVLWYQKFYHFDSKPLITHKGIDLYTHYMG